jgi:hypothetical protein
MESTRGRALPRLNAEIREQRDAMQLCAEWAKLDAAAAARPGRPPSRAEKPLNATQ